MHEETAGVFFSAKKRQIFIRKQTKRKKMKKTIMLLTVIIIIGVSLLFFKNNGEEKQITNFEECAAAGYPVMESYPRQCRTPNGTLFKEETKELEFWKNDDITLMQIPETGEYVCFGCGKIMCKDPAPGLTVIEETPEQYCDEDLELVKS